MGGSARLGPGKVGCIWVVRMKLDDEMAHLRAVFFRLRYPPILVFKMLVSIVIAEMP